MVFVCQAVRYMSDIIERYMHAILNDAIRIFETSISLHIYSWYIYI